ncbi:MAG TPA: hypothetical protein VHD35_12265 [Chitinophagaceae bacterium]|nr:hypothetical protein [Chitinophagaceae bacterium]HVZ98633.1 hypothetical protein [Chitinophagaceae bacterium]
MAEEIISRVWQLHGALALGGYVEGVLRFSEGTASFITAAGVQFNVPVTEVKKVQWPFYQFGLCFTALVNEKKYRFVFSDPFPSANTFFEIDKFRNFVDNLDAISSGRDAAKKWKAVLGNK